MRTRSSGRSGGGPSATLSAAFLAGAVSMPMNCTFGGTEGSILKNASLISRRT